jgi:hypothetical protein
MLLGYRTGTTYLILSYLIVFIIILMKQPNKPPSNILLVLLHGAHVPFREIYHYEINDCA